MSNLNDMIGLTPLSVQMAPNLETVVLDCGEKKITLSLDGDCCSRSYFADPNQFDELIGKTITAAEERDLGDATPIGDEDCVQAHCLILTTNGGHVTIDWRNDSNGYYDGTLTATVT